MTTHEVNIPVQEFDDILNGCKTFLITQLEDKVQVNDTILLREKKRALYTKKPRTLRVSVTYLLHRPKKKEEILSIQI